VPSRWRAELGGLPLPWERITRYLPLADLVIGVASVDGFLLGVDALDAAIRERRRRPIFLIDLAVPRCVDPAVNQLDGVYLYDIDDLETVVVDNQGARTREAVKAEAIVETEVDAFWRWLGSLDAVPTIVALREKIEAMRRASSSACSPRCRIRPRAAGAIDRLTVVAGEQDPARPLSALRRPPGRRRRGLLRRGGAAALPPRHGSAGRRGS
jgi:glutamyl-tRNA reductase